MIANNVTARVKACISMAAVNVLLLFAPAVQGKFLLLLLLAIVILNLAACRMILRGVNSSPGAEEHIRAANLAKRWALSLAVVAIAVSLGLVFAERFHKQEMVFFLSAFCFILMPTKVLDLAVKNRIKELVDSSDQ